MFTGLVEETGELAALTPFGRGTRLTVKASLVTEDVKLGDSIAVNGCCLTVTEHKAGELSFDLLNETLRLTNLGDLIPGSPVNLERAIAAGARMGGHFVQGHIDCSSEILALDPHGADHRLEIELPKEFAHLVAFKGSVAVDGISLTVAEALADRFVIWLIPHTMSATNLRARTRGDRVNLEFDLLAKYLDRMVSQRAGAV